MTKVLITGHKGFIGSNLLKKAKKLGWYCLTLEYNESVLGQCKTYKNSF